MKRFLAVAITLMMVLTLGVFAADVTIDASTLPGAIEFSPAKYTAKILRIESEDGVSIGTANLADYAKITVSYGGDPGVAFGEHNIYVCQADGTVIAQAKLSQNGLFWADGQRTVDIAIDSDYNGEIFLKKDKYTDQIAIDKIVLSGDATVTPPADDPADNPATSDAFTVIAAVAMIALAGTVVCKKVRV